MRQQKRRRERGRRPEQPGRRIASERLGREHHDDETDREPGSECREQQARKELSLYPDGSSMHTYVDEMLAQHKMLRRLAGLGPTVYDRKTKRLQGQRLRKKGY